MALNTNLLYEVARQVELDPKSYNQQYWCNSHSCKTVACIAGWVMQLDDWEAMVTLRNASGNRKELWPTAWSKHVGYTSLGAEKFEFVSMDDTPKEASKILGMPKKNALILFSSMWKPKKGLTVPGALRAIAEGASVKSVTDPEALEDILDSGDWWH